MTVAKLTLAQANYLKMARTMSEEDRSAIRAQLFRIVKQTFGIPEDHKLRVEIDDTSSSEYLVLIRKKTSTHYLLNTEGKWIDPDTVARKQPVRRWFAMDNRDTYEAALDALRAEGPNWFDGDAYPAADLTFVPDTDGCLAFDEHGNVWLACEEADL